ncbi:MAG TPA: hypothetical protein VFP68_14705 [Burkholderiaceae bacterium]|nr:hypothetical protein [Burkholderiaceae bacterium]
MEYRFVDLFESKGISRKAAADLSEQILQLCPWLNTEEEVSEEIGIDLLREVLDQRWLNSVGAEEIIRWHNASVQRAHDNKNRRAGRDPYGDLCTLISKFGVEDAFGEGDYWVVVDSFSTRDVSIVKFADSDVAPELQAALRRWLSESGDLLAVSVIDEDGNLLFRATN